MTEGIVLDASATLAWLFDDDGLRTALRPILEHHTLVAPSLWRLEVVNAVLNRVRRNRLDHDTANRAIRQLADLPVAIDSQPTDMVVTYDLGVKHQRTSYDATYLELALRIGHPLLTTDGGLAQAAQEAGVVLVYRRSG